MIRASETSMSNEQRRTTAFTVRSRQLSRVVAARAYLATKKDKKKTRIEQKNERRKNGYARVRRYKITSTLGLLLSYAVTLKANVYMHTCSRFHLTLPLREASPRTRAARSLKIETLIREIVW